METSSKWHRRMHLLAVLSAAIVAGVVSSEATLQLEGHYDGTRRKEWADALLLWAGLREAGPEVLFESPLSPNKVSELVYDKDKDGEPDSWTIKSQGQSDHAFFYSFDLGYEGEAGKHLYVAIGSAGQVKVDIIDDGGDLLPSQISIRLKNPKDLQQMYYYSDDNADGILDSVVECSGGEPKALFDIERRPVGEIPQK